MADASSAGLLQSIIQLIAPQQAAQTAGETGGQQSGQQDKAGQKKDATSGQQPIHIIIPPPMAPPMPTNVTDQIFGQGQLIAPMGMPAVPALSDIFPGLKSGSDSKGKSGGLADVIGQFTGGGKGNTTKGDTSATKGSDKTASSGGLADVLSAIGGGGKGDKGGSSDLANKIAMIAKLAKMFAAA